MGMKRKSLNEKQVATMLAVLTELMGKPYSELNKTFGSMTIEDMCELKTTLNDWYQGKVLGKKFDECLGWVDDSCVY